MFCVGVAKETFFDMFYSPLGTTYVPLDYVSPILALQKPHRPVGVVFLRPFAPLAGITRSFRRVCHSRRALQVSSSRAERQESTAVRFVGSGLRRTP